MIRRVRRRGISDFGAGLIAVVLATVGLFIAFTSINPFSSPYELHAVVADAQNLQSASPVRVAGVEVGKVKKVEPLDDDSGAARVTMEIADEALPIHPDAELQVRPRLFLEGNYVVDLKPGSPSAGTLTSGSTIPIGRTGHSVSFEEILRVLDIDTRRALQTLLGEYGRGLDGGGAEGFNASIEHWAGAYRATALASDAFLGTEAGDLQRVLRGQQRTFAALARDPRALQELITDLNATTAAFAREDEALRQSIPALRDTLETGLPALDALNAALPSLRAFAREALPGVRSSGPALAAAQPFVEQLRRLVSEAELKGVARELRRTTPALVRLNQGAVDLLSQGRALSSCTENVLVPFAETPIPDPDFPANSGEPFYREVQRAFTGLAGESRTGDANGQWFRLNAGSGPTTFVLPGGGAADTLFSQPLFPELGTRPAKPADRPDFRPDVPCETQEPPDLNAAGGPPAQEVQPQPRAGARAAGAGHERRLARELRRLEDFLVGEREDNPFALGLEGRR